METSTWLPYAVLVVFLVVVVIALFRMGAVDAALRMLGIEINFRAKQKEGGNSMSATDIAESEVKMAGRDIATSDSVQEPGKSEVSDEVEQSPMRVARIKKSKLTMARRDIREKIPSSDTGHEPSENTVDER